MGPSPRSSDSLRWPVLASIIGLLIACIGFVEHPYRNADVRDFAVFYYAVQNAERGGSLYTFSGPRRAVNWNPPHFHLLVWPLQWFSVKTAFLIWTLFGVACALVGVGLVCRALRAPPQAVAWTAAVLLNSAPLHANLSGQVGMILMLPITLAWLAARRDRSIAAGAWLALAVTVKPFLAPVYFWFVARRQWAALVSAACTAAGLFLSGAVVFGWQSIKEWVARPAVSEIPWADHYMNSGLSALLAHGVHPAAVPAWIVLSIAVLCVTAAVIALRQPGLDRSWTLLTCAGLLASPLAWIYYWWYAVPSALSLIFSGSVSREWITVALIGMLWPMRLSQNGTAAVYPVTLLIAWMLLLLGTSRPASDGRSCGTAGKQSGRVRSDRV